MKIFSRTFLGALLIVAALAGCSSDNTESSANKEATITLVTYDSFPTKDTSLNDALKDFTKESGITVKVVNAGDTGTMLAKAELTAGNPEGDVMWGVDNTLLSRALEEKVFTSYKADGVSEIPSEYTDLVKKNEATPVDFGDVCINYDIAYFNKHNVAVPTTLDDLTKPEYKNLLAVQDPASSSTGLAFMLATKAHFGDDWENFWTDLRNNGVDVSESWDSAYYEKFSGSSGKGDFPLVVSYATSPVAEVVYSDPPTEVAPTGNADQTCFRQVEFAGILRGTKHEKESQKLIDFLISKEFQKEIPLNLFVYPSRSDVALPEEFTTYSSVVADPLTMDPETIDENREDWVNTWTQLVIR